MVVVAPLIWMVLAQGPATSLSGTVVGPNGEPVAGAELLLAGLPVYDPPILARGRSDAQGRFRLDRPAGLAGENRIVAPTLWVVKPGFRLSSTRFAGPLPGADEPVRVVLGPPGKAEVRVEGPNGEPVAGARVRLEWFGRAGTNVPDAVVDLIEATTDPSGLAVIDAAANDEVAYVDVHSKAFGIQGRPFFPRSPEPKRIWLRPAASLAGRLVADDPAMARGWQVSAYTRTGDPWSRDATTTGYATGTTDAEGRFSFPVIALGGLQVKLKPPRDLPVIAQIPESLVVIEGRANAFEIPLTKTRTVTGLVLERGTGRPIAGVEMDFGPLRGGNSLHAKTDAQGRYTFPSLPGESRLGVSRLPPTHVLAISQHWRDFTVAEAAGRIELEPWEAIPAAPPLRFVVRDEAGRPVAHAIVAAQSASRWMPRTTDEHGEYVIPGLPPTGEVSIEVRQGDRMTDGPVKAIPGDTDPVVVTIVPGLTLALAGRVLGAGGTLVSAAAVKVQFRDVPKDGRLTFPQDVRFDRGLEVRTGPDGTFRTPKELYKKARDYRIEATADGFLTGQTDWVSPGGGDLITLPDITLRRSRAIRFVSGRVIDRQGKGVAGAAVFQSGDASRRTATTTDGEGHFRLAGVPSTTSFVFAEKAGFRFGGTVVGPAEARADVRLARVDEPPLSIPKPTPPPMSRAEERAMARELLAPLVVAARSRSLGFTGQSVIPVLARVDPDRVLEMLENRAVTPSPGILKPIELAQLETDPRAAIATIEADRDPFDRAEGFLAIADAMPRGDRAHRIELIDRALAEARRVENQVARLQILGKVADRWLELGGLDRATPILREGQAIAASLRRDWYYSDVEEFANVLAAIDLPAARSIFERKGVTNVSPPNPATIDGHLTEAAIRLAAIDPAGAERLVPRMVPTSWDAPEDLLRICRRMARADLPRARRILETTDLSSGPAVFRRFTLLPEGLGLMAFDLAATDPATARGLLDEAFDRLHKVAVEGRGPNLPPVPDIMAAFLPLVERIEPDRLEERIWLAAACREPMGEQPDIRHVQERLMLAMLVSRYDRAVAAAIVAPALERLPELLADPTGMSFNGGNPAAAIKALAAYDPRAVAAMLQALPASARKAPEQPNSGNVASLDAQLRLATAEMLGLPLEERRWAVFGRDYENGSSGRSR